MGIKRAVVTGGAGFIGSHVVDALITRGSEVLVVDDFSTGQEENLEQATSSRRVSIRRTSICSEEAARAIKEFKPELVCHLAAQMNVRRSVSEPMFDAEANIVGTINMLEAAVAAGASGFVFSSTGGAIYGEQEEFPAPETHATKPESPYGVSKRAAELYLEYYSHAASLSVTSLRLSNVFGPRQNPKGEAGVVAIFCERLIRGEELFVNGEGTQTRDYISVFDVVDAFMRSAESSGKPGFRVYNVGTGHEASVLDLLTHLREIWQELALEFGKPNDFKFSHRDAAPGEQLRSVIDASRLSNELGWQPSTQLVPDLRETLKDTFQRLSN